MGKRDALKQANNNTVINTPEAGSIVEDVIENINSTPSEPLKEKPAKVFAAPSSENIVTRQTFYVTFEEIEALTTIAYEEGIKKNELIRELLDSALEQRCPGIFEKVKDRVERTKARKTIKVTK